MKIIFLLVIFAVVVHSKPAVKNDKLENMNVDEVLSNRRLLGTYINCLLETGKCSPDGVELKRFLPDALKTDCDGCSEGQRAMGEKVLMHLIDKEPEYFTKLEAKYDPDGEFKKKYKDEIKAKLGKDI